MSNNPYQTPSADLSSYGQQQYDATSIFSTKGRIGRINFAAYNLGMFAALCIFFVILMAIIFSADSGGISADISAPLLIVLFIIGGIGLILYLAVSIILSVKRFHDFDVSGWWYLISFIPYVGGVVGIFLMLKGGDEDENRFGYPPAPASQAAKWVIFASIVIILASIVSLAVYS